jgi:sulfur carrier protein ThiS
MGRVEIRLHASLRKWASIPAGRCELNGAKTVRELLLDVGIPEQEAAIIIVNGRRGRPETVLSDGDTVSLFPLIGGG